MKKERMNNEKSGIRQCWTQSLALFISYMAFWNTQESHSDLCISLIALGLKSVLVFKKMKSDTIRKHFLQEKENTTDFILCYVCWGH